MAYCRGADVGVIGFELDSLRRQRQTDAGLPAIARLTWHSTALA
jgi:hypothetical protein